MQKNIKNFSKIKIYLLQVAQVLLEEQLQNIY